MTNSKYPNKIHLLGETYKIKEVSKKFLTCDTCKDDCLGKIIWDEKIIYICNNLDDDDPKIEEVLFHELGHYFGDYYGIGSDETFAESFGKFMSLVIRELGYVKK